MKRKDADLYWLLGQRLDVNKHLIHFHAWKPVWKPVRRALLSRTEGWWKEYVLGAHYKSPGRKLGVLGGVTKCQESIANSTPLWELKSTFQSTIVLILYLEASVLVVLWFTSLCCFWDRKFSWMLLSAIPPGGLGCMTLKEPPQWCIFTDEWASCLRLDRLLIPRCSSVV